VAIVSPTAAQASIIVAVISLVGVVFSLGWNAVQQRRITELEERKRSEREAETKAAQAAALVARFRDPLLGSAYDLQSRLYNALSKAGTFRWRREDDYFLPSTLFLVGQFFGWVEILRRDMLYSDIANVGEAKLLLTELYRVQSLFSGTSGRYRDCRRIYRVEQRAIGELMIEAGPINDLGQRRRDTIGYAKFMQQLDDAQFARWFARFSAGLDTPPPPDQPDRLRAIQVALIGLVDFLDPNRERFPSNRKPLPGDTERDLNKQG
jgi:hypothetical protein